MEHVTGEKAVKAKFNLLQNQHQGLWIDQELNCFQWKKKVINSISNEKSKSFEETMKQNIEEERKTPT